MFRLSQKADYGLILLSNLSKSKSPVSIARIARENKISSKFLSQIANELRKANMIVAKEGTKGGYKLARKAEDIKLLEVLNLLDGELVEGKCFEAGHQCSCGAGDMWKDVKIQLEATIGSKTVADLVNRSSIDNRRED